MDFFAASRYARPCTTTWRARTKCFSKTEMRSMMEGFEHLSMQVAFSPGDLLLNQPSVRFRSQVYRLIWKLYPRKLMRLVARRLGLCLLISAAKPAVQT